jgi:hypothetical protein
MKQECRISESEICRRCNDRICSKSPIIEHILASGDKRKITNLTKVLSEYDFYIKDFI